MDRIDIQFILIGVGLFVLTLIAGAYDSGRAQRVLPECPIIERIRLEESRYSVALKSMEYKYLITYQCKDGVEYREVW